MIDAAVHVNVYQLIKMAPDFKGKFSDLKYIDFPTWMIQPLLVDMSDASIQSQEGLSQMQNEESVKTL